MILLINYRKSDKINQRNPLFIMSCVFLKAKENSVQFCSISRNILLMTKAKVRTSSTVNDHDVSFYSCNKFRYKYRVKL